MKHGIQICARDPCHYRGSETSLISTWVEELQNQLLQDMRGPSWGGDFAETNALAFGSQGPAEAKKNYVEKRKRKAKGLEIVFDPQAHK